MELLESGLYLPTGYWEENEDYDPDEETYWEGEWDSPYEKGEFIYFHTDILPPPPERAPIHSFRKFLLENNIEIHFGGGIRWPLTLVELVSGILVEVYMGRINDELFKAPPGLAVLINPPPGKTTWWRGTVVNME